MINKATNYIKLVILKLFNNIFRIWCEVDHFFFVQYFKELFLMNINLTTDYTIDNLK